MMRVLQGRGGERLRGWVVGVKDGGVGGGVGGEVDEGVGWWRGSEGCRIGEGKRRHTQRLFPHLG